MLLTLLLNMQLQQIFTSSTEDPCSIKYISPIYAISAIAVISICYLYFSSPIIKAKIIHINHFKKQY